MVGSSAREHVASYEIAGLLGAVHQAYPKIAVDEAAFVEHVTEVTRVAGCALQDIHAADLYLAYASARGDVAAQAELETLLMRAAQPVLLRFKLDADRRDELVQRVRVRLNVTGENASRPRLLSYRGNGPLEAWLRTVTANVVYNFLAAQGSPVDADDAVLCEAASRDNPELQALVQTHAATLREALQSSIAQLSDRDRAVLRFYVVENLTIDDIGTIYGTHRATAARWVQKAHAVLAANVRREFCVRSGSSEAEFYSLARALPSYFDLSIERALVDAATKAG
jgi:RNA polymerase sigma-70 factor, ECF subfamily